MSFTIHLEQPPIGIATNNAREGDKVRVIYSGFSSSEDGDAFIANLEGFPAILLSRLPNDPPIRPSTIDHLVAVIHPGGTTDVYVNEFSIRARARLSRAVEEGQVLYENDIVDIEELRFGELTIPANSGLLVIFSQGWRKAMFYDFAPLLPTPIMREYNIWALLGNFYNYLTFQQTFKISNSDWEMLFDAGWFPFVGLKQETVGTLLNHVRAGWNPDELLPAIATEVQSRLPEMQQYWLRLNLLAAHHDILARAIDRFQSEDYVSATTILYPRIEGVLRDIHANTGGSSFKQGELARAPMKAFPRSESMHTRMLPLRFREFLEKVYFAPFDPNNVKHVSRHTVAHGVAPVEKLSLKSSVLGLLLLEQICFHLPPDPS